MLERWEAKRQRFQQQADLQTGGFAAGIPHRYVSEIPTAVPEQPVAPKTAVAAPVAGLRVETVIERQAYEVGDRVTYVGTDSVLQALMVGLEMSISRISDNQVECLMPDCSISTEIPLSDLQLKG